MSRLSKGASRRVAFFSVLTIAAVIAAAFSLSGTASAHQFSDTQAMEGSKSFAPGDTLAGGFHFKISGWTHPATVTFANAQLDVPFWCVGNNNTSAPNGHIIIPLTSSYVLSTNPDGNWIPASSQSNPATYQGQLAAPDGCNGGLMRSGIAGSPTGPTISFDVQSTDTALSIPHFQWHYALSSSKLAGGTSWSSDSSFGTDPTTTTIGGGSTTTSPTGSTSSTASTATTATTSVSTSTTSVPGTSTTSPPATSTTTSIPQPPVPLDFLCYQTSASRPKVGGVNVTDQFGSVSLAAGLPHHLCNPANKNGDNPNAPSDPNHLVGYPTRGQGAGSGHLVRVTNQFGQIGVQLGAVSTLKVPAAKSLTGTPTPLANPGDRFNCYVARPAPSAGGPFNGISNVTVQDQFGTLQVNLGSLFELCAPANVNGHEPGAESHATHLMCYTAKPTVRRSFSFFPVFTTDEFRSSTLAVDKVLALCVPSTKVVVS